jgi:ribosome-binding factor A
MRQKDRDHRRGGSDGGSRMASQRRRRVGEELRHVIAQILREGHYRDPVLRQASITVSEVRLSPDLRNATAYVMPLGGGNVAAVLAALKRGTPALRALVAPELTLRYTPNLTFALDMTFDQADRISALLALPEVERDLDPTSPPAAAAEHGEDDG